MTHPFDDCTGYHKKYTHIHTQASMLLAGIGTGGFSLGSRGQLKDWEIFNHPDRGNQFPYTFFSIYCHTGNESVARILESRLTPPFESANGLDAPMVSGLPRFASSEFSVRFPFVKVSLTDDALPFSVTLEAFNPFIPLNADDSGIPAGVLRYRVTNHSTRRIDSSVCGSLYNASGFCGVGPYGTYQNIDGAYNQYQEQGQLHGIVFDHRGLQKNSPQYGNLALMTKETGITVKPEWSMGQRVDGIQDFWDDFCLDGKLEAAQPNMGKNSQLDENVKLKIGSLCVSKTIEPGDSEIFTFVISWYFPNRIKAWPDIQNIHVGSYSGETVRNYYATLFDSAWNAGQYLMENMTRLEGNSRTFADALYSSTLPESVLDAVSANLAILKSTTCFRIENGHMFGFEGCLDHVGSCPGNCTHVWNYAQAMAYLFPELERSMRYTDFLTETDENGLMQFRAMRELNGESWGFLPAVDGQMGTIVRLYRDWLISGDDAFLRALWPKAILALEYGIQIWDTDDDFVLNAMMHVDYDVEFYGVNPLGNLCYLAALKAAVRMASYLGDTEHAEKYQNIFSHATDRADALMWNGEYYIQALGDVNEYKYQHGTGCLADQLLGQFLANMAGLGYVINPRHVRKAAQSIFKYNFLSDFTSHHNPQRTYAVNDEAGLLMTTWPYGGRPNYPFFYADEAWSRTEYHVAATLFHEGLIDQGVAIVKATRERYNGFNRNPWNEFECGFHYSGIMSSWGMLIALSGYQVDVSHNRMSFSPKIHEDRFSCFWSNGKAWGTYTQTIVDGETHFHIETLYGDLSDMDVLHNPPSSASSV